VNYIKDDLNGVKPEDYESALTHFRVIHHRARLCVSIIENVYDDLKRRRITPKQAQDRLRAEGIDLTGGAS
jgi:hypothetical protein